MQTVSLFDDPIGFGDRLVKSVQTGTRVPFVMKPIISIRCLNMATIVLFERPIMDSGVPILKAAEVNLPSSSQ